MRWFVLMLVSLSSSGCATLWTVLEVTGADWQQGESVSTKPLGPAERKLEVHGEYVPPAPVVVSDAPPMPAPEPVPGVVVVEPAPQPRGVGRPYPQGSLKLACAEQERFTREEVTKTIYRYDGVWKALTGFMFVAEAAISGLLLWASLSKDQIDAVPLGVGIFFGLDALGTAVLFWHPPQAKTKKWEQDGQWRVKSRECAPQLQVATSTGPFPVEKSGEVPGLGEWLLQHLVDTEETYVDLQLGQTIVPWRPEVLEKCAWAEQAQSPAPFCRWASGFRRETIATIPLQ
ncbi:MAG: hypothetical protein ACO1OB_30735 [Archangium sp.]